MSRWLTATLQPSHSPSDIYLAPARCAACSQSTRRTCTGNCVRVCRGLHTNSCFADTSTATNVQARVSNHTNTTLQDAQTCLLCFLAKEHDRLHVIPIAAVFYTCPCKFPAPYHHHRALANWAATVHSPTGQPLEGWGASVDP